MKTIKVNGIEIAYTRRGTGNPLMLVHGFPLDHTMWNETAALLEDDFDLILPDLRGFGESATVETPYFMNDMADDLAALLDNLKINEIAIAGHSMGGYVALAFAKKYPHRVKGLALVASQAAADAPDRREGRYKTAQDVAEKGVGVVADAMTSKLSTMAEVQSFVRAIMERQIPSAVIGALKAMAEREDMSATLAAFSFPVLVVHGDEDALIPVDRGREVKSLVLAAHLTEIQGAGHMPMLEFPKETAAALKILK
ncbi:MAG: alpha/beta hydrolase [Chloroflexi bacterium]|nr:alpha/beta hydrolase [Chloroflexota bacterium]